MATYYKAEI